jgi:metal-responsive CopG/Arc/MetJ family transcriptional regulator
MNRHEQELGWLSLSMPKPLVERLDEWIANQDANPGRPAAIRWIVDQFLQQERAQDAAAAATPQRAHSRSRRPLTR